MRYVECDVCENRLDPDTDVLELVVPGQMVNGEDAVLHADICSWECLRVVTDKFDPQEDEPRGAPHVHVDLDAPQPASRIRRDLDEGPKNSLPGVRIKTAGFPRDNDY